MTKLTYGVAAPETMAGMSGLAFLQAMCAGTVPQAPIARTLGFHLVDVSEGYAAFVGEPTADYYNPAGAVHGGWTSTLLDSCLGCAVATTLPVGVGYTTLELKVNMVRAISSRTGMVRAEGRVLHAGRRVATAEGKLLGPDGKLLAHGSTTCLVMPGEAT